MQSRRQLFFIGFSYHFSLSFVALSLVSVYVSTRWGVIFAILFLSLFGLFLLLYTIMCVSPVCRFYDCSLISHLLCNCHLVFLLLMVEMMEVMVKWSADGQKEWTIWDEADNLQTLKWQDVRLAEGERKMCFEATNIDVSREERQESLQLEYWDDFGTPLAAPARMKMKIKRWALNSGLTI